MDVALSPSPACLRLSQPDIRPPLNLPEGTSEFHTGFPQAPEEGRPRNTHQMYGNVAGFYSKYDRYIGGTSHLLAGLLRVEIEAAALRETSWPVFGYKYC